MTRHLPRLAWLLLALFALGALPTTGCGGGSTEAPAASAEVWTCSMHPQIRQPEAGQCPICGMDLIVAGPSDAGANPDRIVLSERAKALSKLRTTEVRRQSDATAQVRLLGKIEPAETSRKNVTTWIGGRIDRLHVNTTGERVRRGQTIATLYSPEIYSAHQDLITASAQVAALSTSPDAAQSSASSALRAAQQRLRLLGVPESEIDTMATAETPSRSVAIRSPFRGTVIERVATEGAYVETGAPLYRVADLDVLWVQLDAYESDLSQLSVGQSVDIRVEALPGESFEGRVAFIDPTVDPQRRTARVRVEVDNPEGRLRPGLFAEAVVAAGSAEGDAPLVIPSTAPLFTGRRSVVYLESVVGDEVGYEPRTVRLGPRLGEVYPVVSGLSAGDRVVSRGAFALDADLQIRGGNSMMYSDEGAAQPDLMVPLGAADRSKLAPVLEAYLGVQRALGEDDHLSAVAAATRIGTAVESVTLKGQAAAPWKEVATELKAHATHVAKSDGLEGARQGFEPLSLAIESLLKRFGNPLDAPVQVAFCPMAMGSEGARWVQQGDTIDNAYFGASMRSCGSVTQAVAPNTYLEVASTKSPPSTGHEGHNH